MSLSPAQRPDPRIYGHVERLVPITVGAHTFDVPDGVTLIRAFQFIEFELGALRCDWSRFCFNDTIGCCTTRLASGDAVRACCTPVTAGLAVERLPVGCHLLEPSA